MFSPIFSSVDKGSTRYHLSGVVEHIGCRKLLAPLASVGKLSPDIALCGPMALLLESLTPFLTSRQGFMFSDVFSSTLCS
jgi:hypothetical protein